jgi:spore maturation protein CgeB
MVIGDFEFEVYEKAISKELANRNEYKVVNFSTLLKQNSIVGKTLAKFGLGWSVRNMNKELINEVKFNQPQLIFISRGRHINPKTIKILKEIAKVFYYNNDDPFSKNYPRYYWRNFRKSLKYFDHIFCYRQRNIIQLLEKGFSNSSLLLPYYIPEYNFSLKVRPTSRKYDIVFVGHFENDGRDKIVLELLKSNLKVKVFGTEWKKSKHYNEIIALNGEIKRLNSIEYNKILNNSKFGLVFLSKKNNDSYTRRCFEIPTAGTIMIAERTNYLESNYEDGIDILFFETANDILKKVKGIDEKKLNEMSKNSLSKINSIKASLSDRVTEIIEIFQQHVA